MCVFPFIVFLQEKQGEKLLFILNVLLGQFYAFIRDDCGEIMENRDEERTPVWPETSAHCNA